MRMIILLVLVISASCITNEGDISIGNKVNNTNSTSTNNNDSTSNNNTDSSSNTVSILGKYKRVLTATNATSSTETNTTFRYTFDSASLISAGKMKNDCGDIRMQIDGEDLATWIADDTCNTSETDLYFKIPTFDPSEISIDLFYGDLTLSSTHNISDTFPLHADDFNRSNLFDKVNTYGDSYIISYQPALGSITDYAAGSMGNFTITNGKLKLIPLTGSETNGNKNNDFIRFEFYKEDSAYIIAGTKAKITHTRNMHYGMFGLHVSTLSGDVRGGIYKLDPAGTEDTGYVGTGVTQAYSNTASMTASVDHYFEVQLIDGFIKNTCWRSCNWNFSVVSPARTFHSGDYKVYHNWTQAGYGWEMDYYFVRKTLSTGDPQFSVTAEESL